MKLVIDIPQAKYNTLMNDNTDYRGNIGVIYKAIQNGRPIKTGHWVSSYGNYICSECGHAEGARHIGKATHYCSFCGAEMKGEKDADSD